MAKSPKIRPRTKQLNICFHHFREHVRMSTIQFFFIFYQFSISRYFLRNHSLKIFSPVSSFDYVLVIILYAQQRERECFNMSIYIDLYIRTIIYSHIIFA